MKTINSIGSAKQIVYEVSKVIVGKDEVIIKMLLAILARGHILMEDIPGVGKTTMAVAFSRALGPDGPPGSTGSAVIPYIVTDSAPGEKRGGLLFFAHPSPRAILSILPKRKPSFPLTNGIFGGTMIPFPPPLTTQRGKRRRFFATESHWPQAGHFH